MSFLGSLGAVMGGSGLMEALQCCYSLNAISHILSGKAVKRAIRAHYLMDSALKVLLLKKYVSQEDEVDDLRNLYDDVVHHRTQLQELSQSQTLCKLKTWMEQQQIALSEVSRTAKLWFQYTG